MENQDRYTDKEIKERLSKEEYKRHKEAIQKIQE